MRIIIDLQGAQTGSRFRGIGRYSMSLAQAIVRNRGQHEILILLNGLFPDSIPDIKGVFKEQLPEENIKIWQPAGPVREADTRYTWMRKASELVREAYLLSLKPDMVVISSLFEGLGDDLVSTIGAFSGKIPTAVVLYDLIPYLNPSPYLNNPVVRNWYMRRIDHFRRADLWLAISESSRQEGLRYLNLPEDRAVNVSTAADDQFKQRPVAPEAEQTLRAKYGLDKPFVMYTGGIDHRKNIEGLIRAFSILPENIRTSHQLAVVCSVQPPSRKALESLAAKHGLSATDFILTGFVPDDDLVDLYNICRLFVFPSWHEGFGLPALEAMHCGAPVIVANTSSLPEVLGLEEALFDPRDDEAIAAKITQGLTDEAFRARLIDHAPRQAAKFSWDESGRRAVAAFERDFAARQATSVSLCKPDRRPRLAFVSPLPPERSGIADYAAELLPELARHYEIEIIAAQSEVSDAWVLANLPIRDVSWFVANAGTFDRILYHFGNSHYHQHMFELLENFPGVVVLHDFYLGHIQGHRESTASVPHTWAHELYLSHGYQAVYERYHTKPPLEVAFKYPCNFSVLRQATGVIAHSQHAARLANAWYGPAASHNWSIIPLLRVPAYPAENPDLRNALGLPEKAFVVASFGHLGSTKLNHRLLEAWSLSSLAQNPLCYLVFVGENEPGKYGRELTEAIRVLGLESRVKITGWNSLETFRDYLACCDAAVQLRTQSRGETSAAVFDCMNYGIPTIVNANGSMADLPNDAVLMLPDAFDDASLAKALEAVFENRDLRQQLSNKARRLVHSQHSPRPCADLYHRSIEAFYERARSGRPALVKAISEITPPPQDHRNILDVASCIDESLPEQRPCRQLLVDISELAQHDARSGIQRVTRAILRELLHNPPAGYRVEPVYANARVKGYFYARKFTLRFLGCKQDALEDSPVDAHPGDCFLGLDLSPVIVPFQQPFLQRWRTRGIRTQFIVYDLLPITHPQFFPPKAAVNFEKWLHAIIPSDGIICISNAVARDMETWLDNQPAPLPERPSVKAFHLGADIQNSSPSRGLPANSAQVLSHFNNRPTFLMVGTVEPRKRHDQALAAFEALWAKGTDCLFVIVGKRGWHMDEFFDKLLHHPLRNQKLFWFPNISDEYLEKIYAASTCLLAPSEGEGFGLPVIEASQHGLPIIARDLPVFREIAGDRAHYFSGQDPANLAAAISSWLELKASNRHVTPAGIQWLTWSQSANQLKDALFSARATTLAMP